MYLDKHQYATNHKLPFKLRNVPIEINGSIRMLIALGSVTWGYELSDLLKVPFCCKHVRVSKYLTE